MFGANQISACETANSALNGFCQIVVSTRTVTLRNNKANRTYTIIYYSNLNSYMFRLHESAIFKLRVSEIYKK